jgi:hypothetical protein
MNQKNKTGSLIIENYQHEGKFESIKNFTWRSEQIAGRGLDYFRQ